MATHLGLILLVHIVPNFGFLAFADVNGDHSGATLQCAVLPNHFLAVNIFPVRSVRNPHFLANILGHVDTAGGHLDLRDVCRNSCAIMLHEYLPIHLVVAERFLGHTC